MGVEPTDDTSLCRPTDSKSAIGRPSDSVVCRPVPWALPDRSKASTEMCGGVVPLAVRLAVRPTEIRGQWWSGVIRESGRNAEGRLKRFFLDGGPPGLRPLDNLQVQRIEK